MANFYPTEFAFPPAIPSLTAPPPGYSIHPLSSAPLGQYIAADGNIWGADVMRQQNVIPAPCQISTQLCIDQNTPRDACQSMGMFPALSAMPPPGYTAGTSPPTLLGWPTMMTPDKAGVMNFAATESTYSSACSNLGSGTMPSGAVNRSSLHPVGRCKRKAFSSLSDEPAVKFHVNEDRMAMCMNDLHLDNNNLDWHPDLEEQPWYTQQPPMTHNNRSSQLNHQGALPRRTRRFEIHENTTIELCQELEEEFKTKDVLPKVIRDEISKSCMQVMLWRPPGECLTETLRRNKQLLYESSSSGASSTARMKDDTSEETNGTGKSQSQQQAMAQSSPLGAGGGDPVFTSQITSSLQSEQSIYSSICLPEDDSNMEF